MRAWERLRATFQRKRLETELDEELRAHLELAIEDHLRRGLSPAEARRLARIKFGSMDASKEAHRDARGWVWLEGVFYDLRFALRALIRERTFSATAILMLALAAALNVMAFLLSGRERCGPYPDSNRGVLPIVNNFRERQGPDGPPLLRFDLIFFDDPDVSLGGTAYPRDRGPGGARRRTSGDPALDSHRGAVARVCGTRDRPSRVAGRQSCA